RDSTAKKKMVVSLDHSTLWYRNDSGFDHRRPREPRAGRFLQFLTDVASLHDSLHIGRVSEALGKKLGKDNVRVPFQVIRLDSINHKQAGEYNEVTIGFSKPVIYRLQLTNTFPYLMKKILWPALFSLFIVAVTIASLVLLYRTVLRQQRLVAMKNDFISNI